MDKINQKETAYENCMEVKRHEHWWEFINSHFHANSIFRGHANYAVSTETEVQCRRKEVEKMEHEEREQLENKPDKINFRHWVLQSTHARNLVDVPYNLFYDKHRKVLEYSESYRRHLERFFPDLKSENLNLLQLLHVFQHYGLSTPLIDFTENPDTALYFAFSGLITSGVKSETRYANNRYVTIYEVRPDILTAKKMMKTLTDNAFDGIDGLCMPRLGYYKPRIVNENFNLTQQEGAFIFLDHSSDLEEYIHIESIRKNLSFNSKPIVRHLIPYTSLGYSAGRNPIEPKYNVFAYLMLKQKLGCHLFDSLYGIHSDLLNQKINHSCIKNPDNCTCAQKIKSAEEFQWDKIPLRMKK